MGIAEAAGSEVIHYGTTEVLPGVALNMQTIYMSWLTMVIVAAIVFAATRRVQEIPYGIQNLVERCSKKLSFVSKTFLYFFYSFWEI